MAKQSCKQRLLSLPVLSKFIRGLAALKNSNRTQYRVTELELKYSVLSASLNKNVAEQELKYAELSASLNERQLNFKIDIARTLARKQDLADDAAPQPIPQPLPNDLDNFYIAFENQFRGTAQEIRQQQSKYLPFLSALQQSSNEALLILDVGCGRGEWLRLLGEHGYSPQGVDISQTMVDFCRLEGLQAEQGEVLTYLAGLADESLHVISAFHVIEHLSFEQMVNLFDACLRILKPGGKIIFETPNPENMVVGAYSFYLDPTHKNPLPPATVEFVARQRGFSQVDIYRYNPREEVGEDSPLKQQWFCSPVDFAVIAEK